MGPFKTWLGYSDRPKRAAASYGMPDFMDWLEVVSVADVRKARKSSVQSWKQQKKGGRKGRKQSKKFEPGTFGIEIEFNVQGGEPDIDEAEIKQQIVDKLDYELNQQRVNPYGHSRRVGSNIVDDFHKYVEEEDLYVSYEDVDDWEEDDHEEPEKPDRDDYDDGDDGEEEYENDLDQWKDDHNDWKSEKDEVQSQIDQYEEAGGWDGVKEKWAQTIVDSQAWADYDLYPEDEGYRGDEEEKKEEYKYFLEELGWRAEIEVDGDTSIWNVHNDGDGIVELTSPIMTRKDFAPLKELFSRVEHEPTSGNTSCHIHVGLPTDTDGFDLVALTTLADEQNLKMDLKDRNFEGWAKFNEEIHSKLYYDLESRVYTKEEFERKVRNIDRYMGTNVSSFFKQGTVEFRYLSSEILDTPDLVFQWINYFTMLPNIARGRKQLRLEGMVLTRQPDGAVRVDKDAEGGVTQPPESPDELRSGRPVSKMHQQKAEIILKMAEKHFRDQRVADVIDKGYFSNLYYVIREALISYVENHPDQAIEGDRYLNNRGSVAALAAKLKMSDLVSEMSQVRWRELVRYAAQDFSQHPDVNRALGKMGGRPN